MPSLWVRVSWILLALGSSAALPAGALPAYSNLIVFGDSIVDTGNTQDAILDLTFGTFDVTPASAGYFAGRFSNGPNVADYLNLAVEGSGALGSRFGGDNYSYGAARARAEGDPIPDLALQVGAYLGAVSGLADPGALYFLHIGGNDVRDIVQGGLTGAARQQVLDAAVGTITTQISLLAAAGAQHFLFAGVGDVGLIPETVALGAAAQAAGHQASLDLDAAIFAALPAGVMTFDTMALFDAVRSDPTAYGLPAGLIQTVSCLSGGTPPPGGAPTCSDYAFFDSVHPTAALHGVFAGALIASIPEPATVGLLVFGLLVLARRRLAIR
jgi:phospholipase/lecithinase/hemolysin